MNKLIQLEDDTLRDLTIIAKENGRSASKEIELAVKNHIKLNINLLP